MNIHHARIGPASEMRRLAEAYYQIPKEIDMNKLEKQAARDAHEWLSAEMAYGDGAGTRRKLTYGPIQQKMEDIPGYEEAFANVYNSLDLDKYAQMAIKERKHLNRAAKAGQNMRALKSGNVNNLTTGLFIAVGVGIVLHQTGYDKKLEAEAKKLYKQAKVEYRFRKARFKGLNVEKIR